MEYNFGLEYVLSDRNSTGLDAYWFRRSIPTLELAKQYAPSYPEARYILEYKISPPSGVLPTGRSWAININPNERKEE